MRTTSKTLAVAFAAAGILATGAATATADSGTGQESGRQEVSQVNASAKKVYKNVWHTAPSYYDTYHEVKTGGKLYAGKNYFYCQHKAVTIKFKGYENNWWLQTDDDHGNNQVWVNAVYISGGDNNEPVKGVKKCSI